MEKTFLTMEKGDALYYVDVQNSVLKSKCEIKTTDIVSITKKSPDSYDLVIILGNGDTLYVSQNNDVAELDNHSDTQVPPLLKDILKPIDAKIYATTPKAVEDHLKGRIAAGLKVTFTYNQIFQNEQVKLAGLRTLAGLLKYKKPEEVTVAAVVV